MVQHSAPVVRPAGPGERGPWPVWRHRGPRGANWASPMRGGARLESERRAAMGPRQPMCLGRAALMAAVAKIRADLELTIRREVSPLRERIAVLASRC